MTSLIYQFAEKNILIKSIGPHQYTFSFDGTEEQFVESLQNVMDIYGYRKQENWFPGDPCDENNNAYYIESINEDDTTYMAFRWNTKEVWIS